MKNIIYICIFVIFTISNTFAKETNVTTSVAFVGMSMDYREYSKSGSILDSEESPYDDITGTELSVGYMFNKDELSYSHVKLNFMLLNGYTKYKGSYIGSGQPYGSVVSRTQNIIIDTDVTYLHTKKVNNIFEFTYGLGVGYHEWQRALSSSQTEVYKWYYLKPFIGFGAEVSKELKVGLNVEYQHGFDTIMTSSNPKLDFTLGGVSTWEISLPVTYMYSENTDFFFEIMHKKQTINESNVNSGYYEPDSTAYNNYIKFGVGFKF